MLPFAFKPPKSWTQLIGELRWKQTRMKAREKERAEKEKAKTAGAGLAQVVSVKRASTKVLMPERKRREKAATVLEAASRGYLMRLAAGGAKGAAHEYVMRRKAAVKVIIFLITAFWSPSGHHLVAIAL